MQDLRAQVHAALAAHEAWKSRVAAALAAGTAAAAVDDASRDDRCTMGKWLHRTPELTGHPGYEDVIVLHARFHREVSEALRLTIAGGDARGPLETRNTYTQTSADLTRALETWAA